MVKKLKRAFTITELVIVIAVVAILAAVLIPTFANIINKAEESADTQTVTNINQILSAEEIVNGKPQSMYDAMQAVEEGGYKVENLTPTRDGYDMVWDEENNRFALLDENGKTVYSAGDVSQDKWKLWKIVDGIPENYAEEGYSYYAGPDFNETAVLVSAGFDAGEKENIAVTLNIPAGTQKSVTVRTNGGAFKVNAPESEVSHYGRAASLAVDAVAPNSYREYGDIEGGITVRSGRFVLEKAQEITELTAEPGEGQSVDLVLPSGASIKVFTVNNGAGQNVTVTNNGAEFGSVFAADTTKLTFAGGEKPPVTSYTPAEFTVTEVDGGVEITGVNGEVPATLVIPSEIGGQKVVSIGLEAFMNQTSLQTVVIAESVKTIGEAAFYQSSLQSISLPDSLETIELEAFRGCAALEEIVIPNGVANIADYAFYACTALKDADLSGAVTVGSSAFYGCTSLQNVVFGDKLQEIAGGAFGNCGLITADFRNLFSLTEIGRSAFNGCESLESVYIGDSVTTLGSQAFGNCPNLQTVEIGSGLQNIGGTTGALASMPVFYNSENVTSVTIDEENKYFSDRGGNCIVYHAPGSSEYRLVQGFVSSTIPAGVTVIGERAFEGVGIAQVTLPDSVTKIEANAFNTNSALTKINLNNVQTIETGAFGKCSALQEVHVGAALAEVYELEDVGIKRMAFSDCSALSTITCDVNNQTFMADESNSALLSKDGKTLVLGNNTGVVPDGVETIAAYALSNSKLTKVVLPVSLIKVEEFAFSGVRQNLNIFYCGTTWNVKIANEKGENSKLINGTVYYFSETDPGTEGNYWHWAGEPGGEIEVW